MSRRAGVCVQTARLLNAGGIVKRSRATLVNEETNYEPLYANLNGTQEIHTTHQDESGLVDPTSRRLRKQDTFLNPGGGESHVVEEPLHGDSRGRVVKLSLQGSLLAWRVRWRIWRLCWLRDCSRPCAHHYNGVFWVASSMACARRDSGRISSENVVAC